MKPALGLKQLVSEAALPIPVASIRQKPCFSSDTRKCVSQENNSSGMGNAAHAQHGAGDAVPRVGMGVRAYPFPQGCPRFRIPVQGPGLLEAPTPCRWYQRYRHFGYRRFNRFVVRDEILPVAGSWLRPRGRASAVWRIDGGIIPPVLKMERVMSPAHPVPPGKWSRHGEWCCWYPCVRSDRHSRRSIAYAIRNQANRKLNVLDLQFPDAGDHRAVTCGDVLNPFQEACLHSPEIAIDERHAEIALAVWVITNSVFAVRVRLARVDITRQTSPF